MTDSVQVEGVEYISSKRASEITEYTQDYIGQLARGGKIEARRIGGLWYLRIDSLTNYKNEPDEVTENAESVGKKEISNSRPSSLVFFDGKEYISAAEGVKATGYHQDYIGQLARGGKIPARQVGARWYVSRTALIEHKKKKDQLLAAVQVDSVGLRKNESTFSSTSTSKTPEVSDYYSDNGSLLPNLAQVGSEIPKEKPSDVSEQDAPRSDTSPNKSHVIRIVPSPITRRAHKGKDTKNLLKYRYIAPIATIVVAFTFGIYSFGTKDTLAKKSELNSAANSALTASVASVGSLLMNQLIEIVTVERVYIRE